MHSPKRRVLDIQHADVLFYIGIIAYKKFKERFFMLPLNKEPFLII